MHLSSCDCPKCRSLRGEPVNIRGADLIGARTNFKGGGSYDIRDGVMVPAPSKVPDTLRELVES